MGFNSGFKGLIYLNINAFSSRFNKFLVPCISLQDDVLISDVDLLVKQMKGQDRGKDGRSNLDGKGCREIIP